MSVGLKVLGGIGAAALLAFDIATPPTPTAVTSVPVAIENEPVRETPAQIEVVDEPPAIGEREVVEATPVPVTSREVSPKPVPKPTEQKPTASRGCHPSYSGCLQMNAGDYDCAGGSGDGPNYTGPVEVYGSDPFDLDRDNDGWGCE
jgi:hypothetical protein